MLEEKYRSLSKWIIRVVTVCILIYLGTRHADSVAMGMAWLFELVSPLLIGGLLALVLSVPMEAFEKRLFQKQNGKNAAGLRRTVAIILSILLVLGLLVGIAILVIPELINALKLLVQNVMTALDQMATWEENTDFSRYPYGEYLARIDIDWAQLKDNLDQWIKAQSGKLFNQTITALDTIVGCIVRFFMIVVFSIYLLANKENLQRQTLRLIRVWLPHRCARVLTHVSAVCARCFRQFVAGQATEAVILGTLCTIGMLILGLPYAPMIGAMIGVTALIPIVGAFLGTIVGAFLILTVNPVQAFVFVLFVLILQQIEGNLIYPRVMGSKVKLPPMWVMAAVMIGGNLAGPLGMLLGVPVASAAHTLIKEATADREARMKCSGSAPKNDRERT